MKFRLVGLVALMALVIASCGGTSPEAGDSSEGIQVHGDWTINIYNEDGSLDQHVDYSNDLRPGGEFILIGLLEGSLSSSGDWAILIDSPNSSSTLEPCADPGDPTVPFTCIIDATAEYFPSDGRMTLNGSFIADIDGYLVTASTNLEVCDPDCFTLEFTRSPVPTNEDATPVSVAAGQTVQVLVEISFTSG